jgi:hypothetical protein
MWPRFMKEVRWFFLSAVLAIPLSFVYYMMYILNEVEGPDAKNLTMRVYLTGWLVMFFAVYVARVVIRFVKNAVTE